MSQLDEVNGSRWPKLTSAAGPIVLSGTQVGSAWLKSQGKVPDIRNIYL